MKSLIIASALLLTASGLRAGDFRALKYLGQFWVDGEESMLELNPEDFPEEWQSSLFVGVPIGQRVWVATKDGVGEATFQGIKFGENFKNAVARENGNIKSVLESQSAHTGDLIVVLKKLKSLPIDPDSRFAILSFEAFPKQQWRSSESAKAKCSQVAKLIDGPTESLACTDIEGNNTKITAVTFVPEFDPNDEWIPFRTMIFLFSSGTFSLQTTLDNAGGSSEPMVDLDGDGIPEFVSAENYEAPVLYKVFPTKIRLLSRVEPN